MIGFYPKPLFLWKALYKFICPILIVVCIDAIFTFLQMIKLYNPFIRHYWPFSLYSWKTRLMAKVTLFPNIRSLSVGFFAPLLWYLSRYQPYFIYMNLGTIIKEVWIKLNLIFYLKIFYISNKRFSNRYRKWLIFGAVDWHQIYQKILNKFIQFYVNFDLNLIIYRNKWLFQKIVEIQ